jgi:hypothetical protein
MNEIKNSFYQNTLPVKQMYKSFLNGQINCGLIYLASINCLLIDKPLGIFLSLYFELASNGH